MKTVAIVSGGMDSVTLAYWLRDRGDELALVSFDYGQRHGARELDCSLRAAEALGVPHQIVDLRGLRALLSRSALTTDQPVPEGHYAAETMAQTVVPNRNSIMLNVAAGYAVAIGAEVVAVGVHAGDHFIYPDCRPEFITILNALLPVANEGFAVPGFRVEAPWLDMSKAMIVEVGDALDVPWLDTWSCYKGGAVHCGRCGTCVERIEAFDLAGVEDPTPYADREFARAEIETRRTSTRLT